MMMSTDQPREYIRAIIDQSVEALRLFDTALDQQDEKEAVEVLKRLRTTVEDSITAAEHSLAYRVEER